MHEAHLLKDLGLAILGAALLGLPFYLLRLPLLLAYIAAGVLLGGQLGLGFIQNAQSIATMAEIGLVLLLFILGLEINLKKLLQAGKAVLVNGVLQFAGCFALAWFVFPALGLAEGPYDRVYLAMACSLSSTLVVVKILSDRFELDRFTSRITVGILIIQDLWAITFLALQPNLSDLRPLVLAQSLGSVGLLVFAAGTLARYALPWVFAKAGKQPELMLVTAVSWCFGMAGLAEKLHLSKEMGALVAGVAIASFPYQADVAAKVGNLRDFFITLFFVSLGLQIPRPTPGGLALAAAISLFVIFSRLLTVYPVQYCLKYGNRGSLIPALNLAQLSEFALVVAALGVSYGHVQPELLSAFILALVATALLSSQLIPRSHDVYRALNPWLERLGLRDNVAGAGDAYEKGHGHGHPAQVVLLGFYREASSLLYEFQREHSREFLHRVMVVDFNPETHKKLKELGIRVEYGDISNSETLKHLHLDQAQVLVCTVPDHLLKGTSNLLLLRNLKTLAPAAKIVVTAETLQSARDMYAEGAAYVFVPRIVASHYLAEVLDRILADSAGNLVQKAGDYLRQRHEVMP